MNSDDALKKLNRKDLLEMLYEQSKKMDEQQKHIQELQAELDKRQLIIKEAGSIADAAMDLTNIFNTAQEAADIYVDSVKFSTDADIVEETDKAILMRAIRIAHLYIEKVKDDVTFLYSELDEFEKILSIMEVNI